VQNQHELAELRRGLDVVEVKPGIDLDARLIAEESAHKIRTLEDELRKQQVYSQREISDHLTTIEALRAELRQADGVGTDREALHKEIARLSAALSATGTEQSRTADDMERAYLDKISVLGAELASQQRYAADENDALRKQVGALQLQLTTAASAGAFEGKIGDLVRMRVTHAWLRSSCLGV
jgi:hypothetical protein